MTHNSVSVINRTKCALPSKDTPSNSPKSQHSAHRKLDANIGFRSRMRRKFNNTPPSLKSPSQHLHHEHPIHTAFHCCRWGYERGRSEVANLAVLFGRSKRCFALPTHGRQKPFIRQPIDHARLQLGRPPKKSPRPIPAGPADRFALVGTQFWRVFLRYRACAGPAPASLRFTTGKGKTQTIYNDSM